MNCLWPGVRTVAERIAADRLYLPPPALLRAADITTIHVEIPLSPPFYGAAWEVVFDDDLMDYDLGSAARVRVFFDAEGQVGGVIVLDDGGTGDEATVRNVAWYAVSELLDYRVSEDGSVWEPSLGALFTWGLDPLAAYTGEGFWRINT